MVRSYKRRTPSRNVPAGDIAKAVDDVLNRERSIRSVASEIHVNPMTLCRYVKKAKESGEYDIEKFSERHFKPVFSEVQENILSNYLKTAANIYFGLNPKDVRILAYECADAFGVEMPDSWKRDKSAGPDWFSGFMKRNEDLSIRTPEATSMSRATSFNRTNVKNFFDKLATVLDREKFQACDIWNLDETGLTTVQKPRSVVAAKGVKQIGSITSAERGELVTMCLAVSATGNTVPPMFVFPRVRYQDHFVRDGPVGCIGTTHPSGWMTHENFLKFMKHFVKHTKASKEKKVLLLLDNHDSHLHIDILNFARENGIIMLSFPPHCSHKLQPLDRSVYGPLKRQLASCQDSWMRNHPGQTMSIYDLPGQVNEALPKAATSLNIIHGFTVAGVYPFNRDVFSDEEFSPSNVTDRPNPSVGETSVTNVPVQEQNVPANHPPETNASPWTILDEFVQNSDRCVVQVPGDGHCLLHSVRKSLCEEQLGLLTHNQLCFKLRNEIIVNSAYYNDFAADRDIVTDIENYITKKEFNNGTVDLVLAALCNSLGVTAILYQCTDNDVNISAHAPGRDGVQFRGDIHIGRCGQDGNAHYNCIGRCKPVDQEIAREDNTLPTQSATEGAKSPCFSPEHLRPHPKAPPRKLSKGRKRRQTAILTDTPEKNAIESEGQKRKERKSKPKKAKLVKNNSRSEKRKPVEPESSDDEECFCILCLEPYSNSRPREKWIQCTDCKNWAHEECTDVVRGKMYVCHNCDSDYNSDIA